MKRILADCDHDLIHREYFGAWISSMSVTQTSIPPSQSFWWLESHGRGWFYFRMVLVSWNSKKCLQNSIVSDNLTFTPTSPGFHRSPVFNFTCRQYITTKRPYWCYLRRVLRRLAAYISSPFPAADTSIFRSSNELVLIKNKSHQLIVGGFKPLWWVPFSYQCTCSEIQ